MSIIHEPLTLGPELAGTLMSPEEFDAVEDCDESFVYELINGVLVVTPPPAEGERSLNDLLGQMLLNYRDTHPQGSAMSYTLAEHPIRTGNRRRADRVIWTGLGRIPNVRKKLPTVAIEIVSDRRRDRRRDLEAKRDEYREARIEEYWVIDRFRRRMTVFRLLDAALPEQVLGEHDTYTTPLLPGFELPLARLFGEADRLEAAMREPEE